MPLVSFSHPWYLLLLPVLAAGAIYVGRLSLSGLRGARSRWAMGLRLAIVACVVLALAGIQVRQPTRRLAVLFVLDQSDSIPPAYRRQQIDFVNKAAERMGADDYGGVLVFGGDAYLEMDAKQPLRLRQIHSRIPRDYTNIAGALRLALASFPDNAQRRVVLLSDGNENLGDAVQEATSAAGQVQVDVVPIVYEYRREVMLDKMVIPSEAKVGEPFEVRLIARSTQKTRATLNLLRKGELIARQQVDLLPGPNVVNFNQTLEKPNFYTYEAVIETPQDELPDNNRAQGFVLVRGKPKVLIVENRPADAVYLANALQGQQLDVDVRAPGRLPATLAEFQTYDSIILSNVAAYQLTADQMKAIRSSVRDLGSGLVMIGGENSFGPGAYRGTPIEEALPVDMEVKKQKVMPVGAVAMVLHTCEFDDGNRWARETAAAVIDILGGRDKVGVLLYDGRGENWGIPIQTAANKERLKAQLYNLEPGDMPDFHGIMKLAHDGLVRDAPEAAVRHIIVISDGDPSPPTPQLLSDIQRQRITISTVGIGIHGPNALPGMASYGKGEYYLVRNPAEIPRIFLKEAQRVLKPAIINGRFTPRLSDSRLLTGIEGVPPLTGYVAVSPKEAPGVEVAMVSDKDDPILASWRYGLGKAVAFTSDAKNHWAAPWLLSGGTFTRFWAQAVRWTVRTTSRAELDTTVEINQRRGKVVVDVVDKDGNFVNGLDLRGSVAGETRSPRLRVDQTGPGRYEGDFEAAEQGQYMVGLRYTDRDGTPRSHVVGAAIPYSPEYRDLTANSAILTGLADRSAGRVYPALDAKPHADNLKLLWRHDRRSHTAPLELWPYLVLAGALLLPVDIGVRRLMVTRKEWLGMMGLVYDRSLGRVFGRRPAGRERTEEASRLLGAKQRAAQRMAGEDAGGAEVAPAQADESTEAVSPVMSRPPGPETGAMPTVAGARPITPPPAVGGPEAPGPVAATRVPPEAEAEMEPPVAATPIAPESPPAPAMPPQVTWHRPVEGVNPAGPPARAPAPAAGEPPDPRGTPAEADEGGDSTSRLLRAKRRARKNESE